MPVTGLARIHRVELASWARDERSGRRLLRALGYAPTGARPHVLVASFRSSRPASQSALSDRWIRVEGKIPELYLAGGHRLGGGDRGPGHQDRGRAALRRRVRSAAAGRPRALPDGAPEQRGGLRPLPEFHGRLPGRLTAGDGGHPHLLSPDPWVRLARPDRAGDGLRWRGVERLRSRAAGFGDRLYPGPALAGVQRGRLVDHRRRGAAGGGVVPAKTPTDRPVMDGSTRVAAPAARLHPGDELAWHVPPTAPTALTPQPMDLRVLYEDDDLVVIDKPAGLVVHPGPGHAAGTLVHGLLARGAQWSSIGGVERPGIVHRLDKDTSGLLVIARNDAAHRDLAGQLQDRSLRRRYRAIVVGEVADAAARIDAPIGRDPRHRQRMAVVASGREAITDFRRLGLVQGHTLLE